MTFISCLALRNVVDFLFNFSLLALPSLGILVFL